MEIIDPDWDGRDSTGAYVAEPWQLNEFALALSCGGTFDSAGAAAGLFWPTDQLARLSRDRTVEALVHGHIKARVGDMPPAVKAAAVFEQIAHRCRSKGDVKGEIAAMVQWKACADEVQASKRGVQTSDTLEATQQSLERLLRGQWRGLLTLTREALAGIRVGDTQRLALMHRTGEV